MIVVFREEDGVEYKRGMEGAVLRGRGEQAGRLSASRRQEANHQLRCHVENQFNKNAGQTPNGRRPESNVRSEPVYVPINSSFKPGYVSSCQYRI